MLLSQAYLNSVFSQILLESNVTTNESSASQEQIRVNNKTNDTNKTLKPLNASEFNLTRALEEIEEKDPIPPIKGPDQASEYLGPESIKNITRLDKNYTKFNQTSLDRDKPVRTVLYKDPSLSYGAYNAETTGHLKFVGHTPLPHEVFTIYRFTDSNGLNNGCYGTGIWNPTPEPAVASDGSNALYTGNWFVAKSTDRGNSWDCGAIGYHVNFNHSRIGGGNNCCDNDVVYREPYFYWFRQGSDGRINIATSTDLTNWNFNVIVDTNDNFIPEMDLDPILRANGLTSPRGECKGESRPECNVNFWLDYPKMTVSSEYLYVSASVMLGCGRNGLTNPPCAPGSNSNYGSLVLRAKLTDLNRNIVDQDYFALSANHFFDPTYRLGYTFAEGSEGIMYMATSTGTGNSLRVCSWRGEQPTSHLPLITAPSCTNLPVGTFNTGAATCVGHDNRNWCASTGGGNRIETGFYRSAYAGRGMLGFFWNVAQDPSGGPTLSNYVSPWIKAAVFRVNDAGGLDYLNDESARYSIALEDSWVQRPYVASTRDGLGLMALYGGSRSPPGVVVGLFDSHSGNNWELMELERREYSDTGRCTAQHNTRLGDYIRVRPFGGYQDSPRGLYEGAGFFFDGSSSTTNCLGTPGTGPTVKVFYVVFGRGEVNDIWLGPIPGAMEKGSGVVEQGPPAANQVR